MTLDKHGFYAIRTRYLVVYDRSMWMQTEGHVADYYKDKQTHRLLAANACSNVNLTYSIMLLGKPVILCQGKTTYWLMATGVLQKDTYTYVCMLLGQSGGYVIIRI